VQAVIDRLGHPPVQTPVQITALPPYPQGKAVRWNLWILDAIRDELATLEPIPIGSKGILWGKTFLPQELHR
jgi:hypothetical protein